MEKQPRRPAFPPPLKLWCDRHPKLQKRKVLYPARLRLKGYNEAVFAQLFYQKWLARL
jgi:hypothetical protein